MKGFFSSQNLRSDNISKHPLSCVSCGLYQNVLSPKIKPYGKFKKKVLFVGEAPGAAEDRRGKAWQGDMGHSLQNMVKSLGFNLFRDGLSTNACNCRPPKNRTPEPNEIACCRKSLIKTIKKHKPKVIILLGTTALTSLIGRSWPKKLGGITKWRGWTIPDKEHNAWICPVFHPSYVSRKKERDGLNLAKVIWKSDLKRALSLIDKPIKIEDDLKYVTIVENDRHFKEVFKRIMKASFMSFDYETTGIKPHAKGHQITNVGACISPTEAYSWTNTKYRALLWKKILANKRIKKAAHNIPFENMWSSIIFKTKVEGWFWDSLINGHILDNRKGIGSLKFQTYVNFGVSEYDGLIHPYLQSPKKSGSNAKNRILEFINTYGHKPVNEYVGLDSLYGFWLSIKQMEAMGIDAPI